MAVAAPPQSCPVCEHEMPSLPAKCPQCHTRKDWIDLISGQDFAQSAFEHWRDAGYLRKDQFDAIRHHYHQRRLQLTRAAAAGDPLPADSSLPSAETCWSCSHAPVPQSHCSECGLPVASEEARLIRYWAFVGKEIQTHEETGRLTLASGHKCLAEVRERSAGLQQRLEGQRIPSVAPVEAPKSDAPQFAVHRAPGRTILEILLDPRSIQWLLALGGALLVIGLVIWLATLGVFEDPQVLAALLGAGNAALLAGGWAMILRTRYQLAGRALTLLACLIMPLNLWFYHAQDIITLDGHLWVPALVCCVLYAASALVLRDQMFVYVLMGGVALTGLLILCDLHKFEEIAAPATLLVVLGLIGVHAERGFPASDDVFSRRRFGLAFFWSGHVLMTSGLLLLLGAHVAGDWLYQPVFQSWYEAAQSGPPEIVTTLTGQILSLVLVLAGTYAYLYSDIVVRRIGAYIYGAAITLLWAEVLIVRHLEPEAVIAVLALTALVVNVVQVVFGKQERYLRAVPLLVFCSAYCPCC